MKVTFFGNFLNPHVIPFCDEMERILKEDFKFVATSKISDERLALGFKDYNHSYNYSINSYESQEQLKEALNLLLISDVVIIGAVPEHFLTKRLKTNKLTFRYSERFFKRGYYRLLDPRMFLMSFSRHTKHRFKKLHLLCASAFAARDASLLFAYPDKMWRWGYFPEVLHYTLEDRFSTHLHDKIKILWTSRFIEWKHPEHAIEIAKKLKSKGFRFVMTMIGDGILRPSIEKYANALGLTGDVKFLGVVNPEEVRKHMLNSDIFLFTSDKQEGWGAVLNESMNSGCAVIASDEIGAVHSMIKHKHNGLVYKSGNIEELYRAVESLLLNPEHIKRIGTNAYNTIVSEWNAETAAQRFIKLVECIFEGKQVPFTSGPCSKAVTRF